MAHPIDYLTGSIKPYQKLFGQHHFPQLFRLITPGCFVGLMTTDRDSMGTGMGKEATVPLLPTSGLPRSPCNLPVITRYERPRGLTLVPVICSVTVDL